MMIEVRPDATASSITYWMIGLSTRGSISLGCAFVAGRNRVPSPAAGNTALRIFWWGFIDGMLPRRSARAARATVLSCSVMLDLKFVVENREAVLSMLATRGQSLADVQAFP